MVVAVSLGNLKEEILTLFFNKSSVVILVYFVLCYFTLCVFLSSRVYLSSVFNVSFFSYLCIVLLCVYEWQIKQH